MLVPTGQHTTSRNVPRWISGLTAILLGVGAALGVAAPAVAAVPAPAANEIVGEVTFPATFEPDGGVLEPQLGQLWAADSAEAVFGDASWLAWDAETKKATYKITVPEAGLDWTLHYEAPYGKESELYPHPNTQGAPWTFSSQGTLVALPMMWYSARSGGVRNLWINTPPGAESLTTGTPTITGTVKVGAKLTAKPGAWGPHGVKLSYQWYRGAAKISKATKAGYTPVAADAGKKLSVRVTGALSGYESKTVASVATKTVAKGTLVSKTPKVSGTAKVGKTLKAKPGSWGPKGVKVSYQWYANGKAIKKATKSTLKLAKAQAGKKMTVKVTGNLSGYANATKASKATKKVVK